MSNVELPTIKRTPLTIAIGLTGGLFFSLFYEGFLFFHFIPKNSLMPTWEFLAPAWQEGIVPHILWWVMICILSIIWALLYQWTIKKSDTMWPGIFINVILFAVIFLFFGWWMDMGPDVTDLKHHSIISFCCLFILHGAFVGFSISYDEPYTEEEDSTK
ncbi:YqhR family membrane protein [Jeotgalibacillus sp. ET6]|uniref:YqhR family membrane protein n=1 Tax=Jeotgalibacillus sp. ET6 TaxID=3037260 RepID=UPI0024185CF1|nr:YqhR family membrane protein [Jeotgalibacillus sp. ET6]MDG5470776.1 YqhR family membrane protein [Jeotgalibacillus sp. ET6]